MGIEGILEVLGCAMKDQLDTVDEKVLHSRKMQDVLTAYFAEQQTRPELVAQIRSQSLMYGYLQLALEEREQMERLREDHPDYLKGEGKGFVGIGSLERKMGSQKLISVIKKQRLINQLLKCFNFYLQNRQEGEVFGVGYLANNATLKKALGRLGWRTCMNAYTKFSEEGGFDKLVELASEANPKIKLYSDRKEVLKIDGVAQLLRCFDFYLENRKEGVVFNSVYLMRDPTLNKGFGGLGWRITNKSYAHLSEEGGINYLVQLASRERPKILQYWKYDERRAKKGK